MELRLRPFAHVVGEARELPRRQLHRAAVDEGRGEARRLAREDRDDDERQRLYQEIERNSLVLDGRSRGEPSREARSRRDFLRNGERQRDRLLRVGGRYTGDQRTEVAQSGRFPRSIRERLTALGSAGFPVPPPLGNVDRVSTH